MLKPLWKYVLRSILAVLGAVPFALVRATSSVLATILFLLPLKWNFVISENWKIAFSRKIRLSERWQVWWHFLHNTLSAVRVATLSRKDFNDRITISDSTKSINLIPEDGACIVLTAHLGSWEVLPRMPLIFGPGKYAAIFQALRDPELNQWVKQLRESDGVEVIERSNAWGDSLATLRKGYSLAILADQNSGRHGIWCPFFDALASTSGMPALLAKRTGAPILPLFVKTLPGSRWEVKALAPITTQGQGLEDLTSHLNKLLEERIREYPWDWLWFHERWKLPNPQWLLGKWAHRIHLPEAAKVKKLRVVIRSMNWLGDAIMHLGAIRDMKHARPDMHLAVACAPGLVGLYERCDFVDEVIPIAAKKSLWKTVRTLRNGNFDVAVLMPNSWRVVLEARLAGIPHRAGFRVRGRGRNDITIKVPLEKIATGDEHQSLTWQRAVTYWGAATNEEYPKLKASEKSPRDFCYGVLAPGAAFGPAKRWPAASFAEAARKTQGVDKWLIVGAPGDIESCNEVHSQLSESESLAGKTSLGELIDILSHAQVVISNDSGVMHLAAAAGAPTVGIFGSTSPEATRPVGRCEIVRKPVPCAPCFQRTCQYGHYDCLKNISPEEVSQAAGKALAQSSEK